MMTLLFPAGNTCGPLRATTGQGPDKTLPSENVVIRLRALDHAVIQILNYKVLEQRLALFF